MCITVTVLRLSEYKFDETVPEVLVEDRVDHRITRRVDHCEPPNDGCGDGVEVQRRKQGQDLEMKSVQTTDNTECPRLNGFFERFITV